MQNGQLTRQDGMTWRKMWGRRETIHKDTNRRELCVREGCRFLAVARPRAEREKLWSRSPDWAGSRPGRCPSVASAGSGRINWKAEGAVLP